MTSAINLSEIQTLVATFKFPEDVIMDVDKESFVNEPQLFTNYYGWYYAIVKFLKIQSVLEIGVRAGYSMISMLLANKDLIYFGIDNNSNMHGGLVGSYIHAEKLLRLYGNKKSSILIVDSHNIDHISTHLLFDLVHVDGDHTTDGCRQDLALVWGIAKYILVDDIDFCCREGYDVKQVVDEFLSIYKNQSFFLPSFRGHRLIIV